MKTKRTKRTNMGIQGRLKAGMRRLAALLLAAAMLSAFLAGCGTGTDNVSAKPLSPSGPAAAAKQCLILVISGHANMPRPSLPGDVRRMVMDAAEGLGYLSIICIDGKPSIYTDGNGREFKGWIGSSAPYAPRREKDNAEFVGKIETLLSEGLTARYPETDILAALTLAAREASSSDAKGMNVKVIVCDSGISTKGWISFKEPGMWGVEPNEFAEGLFSRGELPAFDGKTCLSWLYLGDTMEPQEALSNAQRTHLQDLYAAVLKKAGVENPEFLTDTPGSKESLSAHPVTPVGLPVADYSDLAAKGTVTLRQEVLHFIPDTDRFLDADEVRKALTPIVDMVREDGSLRLRLTGMTASARSDDKSFVLELSKARAERVKEAIVEMSGIDPGRIETVGVGDNQDPVIDPSLEHDPDTDAQGRLTAAAAKNRLVRIEIL